MDFTWKIFCMTGNIDTYLIMREMEAGKETNNEQLEGMAEPEVDSSLH